MKKRAVGEFDSFGVMIDCSRGAVYKKETIVRYIDLLAQMGYNVLMLYTEDVYEVEGEPYFGYLRGRYTIQELREMDAYARQKGIELIPCIQTLAHLGGLARWQHFEPYIDTGDIVLAEEPRVYALIEKMFASIAKSFTSRTIHIGMDEAAAIGLGKYLDRHGYSDRFEILCRHLEKVLAIARKYGFEPIMWSDMFFRLANQGQYYEADTAVSDEVKSRIPNGVGMVYWDYYSTDKSHYDAMIEAHERLFGSEIWFAGGAWSWNGFAPNNRYSFRSTRAAIESCREKGIRNVFLTEWRDDGADCSLFSTLPALLYASFCARGAFAVDAELEDAFYKLTGIALDDFLLADMPNGEGIDRDCYNPSRFALYSDPFLGIFDYSLDEESEGRFIALRDRLERVAENETYGYMFRTLSALCDVLSIKYGLGIKTRRLYESKDKQALRALAETDYVQLIAKVKNLYGAFCAQWETECKPNGFEMHDIRFGGLLQRLEHCRLQLLAFADGKVRELSALEEQILPFADFAEKGKATLGFNNWLYNAMIKPTM